MIDDWTGPGANALVGIAFLLIGAFIAVAVLILVVTWAYERVRLVLGHPVPNPHYRTTTPFEDRPVASRRDT